MIFDKSITDRNFIEKPLFCSIAMIEKDFQDKSDILCFQRNIIQAKIEHRTTENQLLTPAFCGITVRCN